ncbi:uncharacterized protein LOC110188632 [Drosophila serrata]|uniref:uncharacterized protein LOC110188632 n=1 Tax=Drosophila serrata TaxID=7274 RepID=UPI000A1D347B|nr:uncharacterized protein LOC110188632 [Drosophila serrata]
MFTRSNNEQQKIVELNEESRAEKAKKIEEFLSRTQSKAQSSLYEFNVQRCPNDDADFSLHPSYNFVVYDLNCDIRYRKAMRKYNKQFQREMAHLIASQQNILDQYYLKRILCYRTSWPPLHTKRELNNFVTKFFQLAPREKKRVDYLMETDLGC